MKKLILFTALFFLLTAGPALASTGVSGDVNGDGVFDSLDPDYLLAYLFTGGPAPVCPAEADANGGGTVDIADAVTLINTLACTTATLGDVNGSGSLAVADFDYLLDYLFSSGPAPVPCNDVGDVNGDGSLSIGDAVALWAILPCPPDLVGDANGDEKLDIADLIVVAESYTGGSGPVPCALAGDINADGSFNIADLIVYLGLF